MSFLILYSKRTVMEKTINSLWTDVNDLEQDDIFDSTDSYNEKRNKIGLLGGMIKSQTSMQNM